MTRFPLLAQTCFVIAACLLVVLFAGCDRKAPPSSSPTTAGAATPAASSQQVRIAAASDLRFAFEEVISAFHALHPNINVAATYGSSGNIYSQLTNRAPFDIFFSADIEYPRRLAEAGLAKRDSLFQYAVGHLVVWTLNTSKLDVERLGIESLAEPGVRRVAIANPQHAPYGRAAEAALKSLGMYDIVKDRLVLGENIAQTAQFIESGAADVGIIALSLAVAPAMKDRGQYWHVPLNAYPPLEQGGVIMSWAQDVEAAEQFKAFVISPEGRAILKRYGFIMPGEGLEDQRRQ